MACTLRIAVDITPISDAAAAGVRKPSATNTPPPATAAGAAEAGGGALLALGFLTPAAAASLIGVMSTAIRKVHAKNGPWAADGGYEYNLALIAMLVALADVGPGDLSLDHALGLEVKGPVVALLALGAGIGGAIVMTEVGSQATEPAPPPTDTPQPEEAAATV